MPRYAQFDSAAPSPTPVLGWFDTDDFKYPNLPAASDLIELTDSQWAVHFDEPSGWTVKDESLIPPEPM